MSESELKPWPDSMVPVVRSVEDITRAIVEPEWINDHAPITLTIEQCKRQMKAEMDPRSAKWVPILRLPPAAELHAKFLKTCGGRINAS